MSSSSSSPEATTEPSTSSQPQVPKPKNSSGLSVVQKEAMLAALGEARGRLMIPYKSDKLSNEAIALACEILLARSDKVKFDDLPSTTSFYHLWRRFKAGQQLTKKPSGGAHRKENKELDGYLERIKAGEEFSLRQIARACNCSTSSVMRRVHELQVRYPTTSYGCSEQNMDNHSRLQKRNNSYTDY